MTEHIRKDYILTYLEQIKEMIERIETIIKMDLLNSKCVGKKSFERSQIHIVEIKIQYLKLRTQ